MPVREVVLDRDIRSPLGISLLAPISRYHLRRVASILALLALDVFAVLVAALAGPEVWDSLGAHIYRLSPAGIAATAGVMACVFAARRMYGVRRYRHRVSRIAFSWLLVVLITALLAVLSGTVVSGWSLIALWFGAALVDVVLRRAYDLALSLAIGRDLDAVRLLFIGPEAGCRSLEAAMIAADPGLTYVTVGRLAGADVAGVRGAMEELWPAEVVIADLDDVGDRLLSVVEACRARHCSLMIGAGEHLARALARASEPSSADADACATGTDLSDAAVCYLPGFAEPVFLVKDTHARKVDFVLKRVLDVLVAATLLVVLLPLLIVVVVVIKLTSPGPVFFRAPRVGVGQRVFVCRKFRTMVADAEARQKELEALNEADGAIFKIDDDPRLTPAGRFLRKTSIDELPQLYNVLRGEMSLVGPRPLPVRDVDLMQAWHKQRHVVLPGITGLWQVSGRSDLGFDEMIDLDFRYIETWSFRRDLAILGRTFGAVFASKGAY